MNGAGELPPGTLVAGWQIIRPLRTGGFGAVHYAEQNGKPFAIKVARHREESGDTGRTHARALQEVVILLTLDHPHIVKARGYGFLPDGRVFCVQEYVDGWTLGEWKERTFPTFREIARVVAQIVDAVGYMDKRGVCHRDLKLSNVMVCSRTGKAVLIDLGCATYENAEELTTTPLPPGTDRYRSPEAWEFFRQEGKKPGARYDTTKADELFAIGVMLYELLATPLPVKEPLRLNFAGRLARLSSAREVNPRVPEAFSALVEDLLAHEPAQRPVSFKALWRRLMELAEHPGADYSAAAHLPSMQRQAPPVEEVQAVELTGGGKPRGRKPLVLAGLVGAVTVAAAAAAWLTHGGRSTASLSAATAPAVTAAPALPPLPSPPVSAPAPEPSPAIAPKEGTPVKPKQPDAPKSPHVARAPKAAPAPTDPGFPAWCKALPLAAAMATEGCASVRIKAEPWECPPGAVQAMEALGWKMGEEFLIRADERGPSDGVWAFTLGAPVTGVVPSQRRSKMVPPGTLFHGTVYMSPSPYDDFPGILAILYDHVEFPGRGKFPVCVVTWPTWINELKDNKATTASVLEAYPVKSWEPGK